ncbi:MAG: hypothetical protein A2W27_07785 [Deltaproteobacteria bacterium RBG_16_44_11]|nr:MAG: hypothetical protein A2W27_07785 [Deltaproteobacteria bacterium RBG_16_44_11]
MVINWPKHVSTFSLIVGILGILFAIKISYPIFWVPRGSWIRPIGPVFIMTIDFFICFIFGFVPSIFALIKSQKKKLPLIAVVACLLPLPIYWLINWVAIRTLDLHLSG